MMVMAATAPKKCQPLRIRWATSLVVIVCLSSLDMFIPDSPILFAAAWSTAKQAPSPTKSDQAQTRPAQHNTAPDIRRRTSLQCMFAAISSTLVPSCALSCLAAEETTVDALSSSSSSRQNYKYNGEWTSSSLRLLSPTDAATFAQTNHQECFPFGRWPDPLLRRPASQVPSSFSKEQLRALANKLRQTAREKKAVGLAAQQCGIDASLVFLETTEHGWKRNLSSLFSFRRLENNKDDDDDGIFLVNPRIVGRSPEVNMQVWTEHCLVLPPSFSATVLRDASVTIECETLQGQSTLVTLQGELARAAQHEMDHDRGILILDHVGLEDMESDDMRRLEAEGHMERMELAFARSVAVPSASGEERLNVLARDTIGVPPASAAEDIIPTTSSLSECDEECLAKTKLIIEERRAMMRQSRTTTKRQDMFDLSRQRAMLYNTTYQGASCLPGVPCL